MHLLVKALHSRTTWFLQIALIIQAYHERDTWTKSKGYSSRISFPAARFSRIPCPRPRIITSKAFRPITICTPASPYISSRHSRSPLWAQTERPNSPRVLVTAVEVSVYTVPATSCGVLYVSKVDSTGQGTSPSPTSTIVRYLLIYYSDPVTRPIAIAIDTLWIQLFARAQGQYLFPNSAEFEGKHPLSDVKLCAWWKRPFSEVVGVLEQRQLASASAPEKKETKMKPFYILPGFGELEATHSLNISPCMQPEHALQ